MGTCALLRETRAHTSVHMSSTPTVDLSWATVKDPGTNLAARRLCTVSWSIGLPESSVPPLKRLQQQAAHLGHPLTVEKVTKDKEAVLVSHPASTPGDARCLTSALTLAEGEKCPV